MQSKKIYYSERGLTGNRNIVSSFHFKWRLEEISFADDF